MKESGRWLNAGYRVIKGLKLGEERQLPTTYPPEHDGGGNFVHIPEGYLVTALAIGDGSLTAWSDHANLRSQRLART
jgi:hypothetical protein